MCKAVSEIIVALATISIIIVALATIFPFYQYDLKAKEPQGLQREGSLMNVLNQKGTRPQDKPKRLEHLPTDDQRRMYARYPKLKNLA